MTTFEEVNRLIHNCSAFEFSSQDAERIFLPNHHLDLAPPFEGFKVPTQEIVEKRNSWCTEPEWVVEKQKKIPIGLCIEKTQTIDISNKNFMKKVGCFFTY